jgi:hypothetical protein
MRKLHRIAAYLGALEHSVLLGHLNVNYYAPLIHIDLLWGCQFAPSVCLAIATAWQVKQYASVVMAWIHCHPIP